MNDHTRLMISEARAKMEDAAVLADEAFKMLTKIDTTELAVDSELNADVRVIKNWISDTRFHADKAMELLGEFD